MQALIRAFLGSRLEGTATGTYAEIFSTASSDRDGILLAVTSGYVEVNDNSTDASPWYKVTAGSTMFLPFIGASQVFIKGTGVYKVQQVRVTPR